MGRGGLSGYNIKSFTVDHSGLLFVKLSHHFGSFMVATMTWLIVAKYLRHKKPNLNNTAPSIGTFAGRGLDYSGYKNKELY
jgi:hypothetical protein